MTAPLTNKNTNFGSHEGSESDMFD